MKAGITRTYDSTNKLEGLLKKSVGNENGFRLFSSELAGIKAFSSRRWEHSNTGIEQFLTLGYLVEPETGYKGIRQLLPGTVETYRVGCSSVS